jgi:hypothetical protein
MPLVAEPWKKKKKQVDVDHYWEGIGHGQQPGRRSLSISSSPSSGGHT